MPSNVFLMELGHTRSDGTQRWVVAAAVSRMRSGLQVYLLDVPLQSRSEAKCTVTILRQQNLCPQHLNNTNLWHPANSRITSVVRDHCPFTRRGTLFQLFTADERTQAEDIGMTYVVSHLRRHIRMNNQRPNARRLRCIRQQLSIRLNRLNQAQTQQ